MSKKKPPKGLRDVSPPMGEAFLKCLEEFAADGKRLLSLIESQVEPGALSPNTVRAIEEYRKLCDRLEDVLDTIKAEDLPHGTSGMGVILN